MIKIRIIRCSCALVALFAVFFLSACASHKPAISKLPKAKSFNSSGHPVISAATKLLGSPYRYGGSSPDGFDCSGFVQYVYSRVGVSLPRSAAEQFKKVRKVSLEEIQPGDLLFFKISWLKKVSHVGIYVESSTFMHAPSSGKRVSYADLQNEYWSSRLVGAGRAL